MSELLNFPEHMALKKRIRKCDSCHKDFEWDENKGSAWFGNYEIIGRGPDAYEKENIEYFACDFKCQKVLCEKGIE